MGDISRGVRGVTCEACDFGTSGGLIVTGTCPNFLGFQDFFKGCRWAFVMYCIFVFNYSLNHSCNFALITVVRVRLCLLFRKNKRISLFKS